MQAIAVADRSGAQGARTGRVVWPLDLWTVSDVKAVWERRFRVTRCRQADEVLHGGPERPANEDLEGMCLGLACTGSGYQCVRVRAWTSLVPARVVFRWMISP